MLRGMQSITRRFLIVLVGATFLASFAAHADIHQDIRKLAKEKRKLEQEIGELFRSKQLHKDAAYQKLEEELFLEQRAHSKLKRSHPELKALYETSDAAQKRSIKAKIDGDNAASKRHMTAYSKARMDLERKAASLPDLQKAQARLNQKGQALEQKRRALLAKTPEGKALVKKLESLDKKIAALREKARAKK